jgi:IS4 transposase
MLFTTLPADWLPAKAVLEWDRYRWQIELAFKWLKPLLKLGRLPHPHPEAATGWIQAKLVVALLLETLYRNARIFSPWGHALENVQAP